MLEVEDAVAMESSKTPWTAQKRCATTMELIAIGAPIIAGLLLISVGLVLVTWRCTKCLASNKDDQNSTRTPSELAEMGNGK